MNAETQLACPSCRRIIVAEVGPWTRRRKAGAEAARCPYPACAEALAAVVGTTGEAVLCSLPEVARRWRRAIVHVLPCLFLAEAILSVAVGCGAYAIHHLTTLPHASSVVTQLARIGIALGGCGLAIPALVLVPAILVGFVRRILDRRRTLDRLARTTSDVVRLRPGVRAYRC